MEAKSILRKGSYEYIFHQKFSPAVKSFLATYLAEKLLYLEPKTYSEIERKIEEVIKYHACVMPDILYNHRTIKDSDQWDNALANFVKPDTEMLWPITQHWFERDLEYAEDEDNFLEDVPDFELTDTEFKAKELIETIDNLITDDQHFALYMRAGYQALNPEARKTLENTAIFDLTILSAEGFIALQNSIDMLVEILLEDLLPIIEE